METLVFISSRQLDHFLSMDELYRHFHVVVIISAHEEDANKVSLESRPIEVLHVGTTSFDGVLWEYDFEACLLHLTNQAAKIRAIITLDEGNLILAARLREALRINGARVEDLLPYRNKAKMKAMVSQKGSNVPTWHRLTNEINEQGYQQLALQLGEKMILKPISSAGSNQVSLIESESDFRRLTAIALANGGEYEIEQFIEGKHFHCDTVFNGEDCIFAACTEYVAPTLDFQSGSPLGGKALPPMSEIFKTLTSEALTAVRCLGVKTVAQHTELIVRTDGMVFFLECGARPPGMLVVQTYEQAYGVNFVHLTVEEMLKQCGTSLEHTDLYNLHEFTDAFYLVYPKQTGQISKINRLPNRLATSVDFSLKCHVGDTHEGCHSNLDFIATAMSKPRVKRFEETYENMKRFSPATYHTVSTTPGG